MELNELNEKFRIYLENIQIRTISHGLTQKRRPKRIILYFSVKG